MHTATRGPGRRKQHYSQATFNLHMEPPLDRRSIASANNKINLNKDRNITLQDVKLILPTLLILLFTVFIMVTVIPYAFSSVIKQLRAVQALEAAGRDTPAPTSSSSQES